MDNLTNFPTLQTIDNKLENATEHYRKSKSELTQTDRYDDNPTERKYQLQELSDAYNAEYDELIAEYEKEMKYTRASVAQDAFSISEVDNKFADTVITQLNVSGNVLDTLELLAIKAELGMEKEQELALANKLGDIESLSLSKAEKADVNPLIERIKASVNTGNSHAEKLSQLRDFQRGYNPDMYRKRLALAEKYAGDGAIG